jgi:hypothetical protein
MIIIIIIIIIIVEKVKPAHATKAYSGSGSVAPLIFHLSNR